MVHKASFLEFFSKHSMIYRKIDIRYTVEGDYIREAHIWEEKQFNLQSVKIVAFLSFFQIL